MEDARGLASDAESHDWSGSAVSGEPSANQRKGAERGCVRVQPHAGVGSRSTEGRQQRRPSGCWRVLHPPVSSAERPLRRKPSRNRPKLQGKG